MDNLDRMVQALITDLLVMRIASIFGVYVTTGDDVAALRALVAAEFPAWQAAIEEQRNLLRHARVNLDNLMQMREHIERSNPDDPRLGAVDAALNALMMGWPNAGGEE